jgi:hypothetical protein
LLDKGNICNSVWSALPVSIIYDPCSRFFSI